MGTWLAAVGLIAFVGAVRLRVPRRAEAGRRGGRGPAGCSRGRGSVPGCSSACRRARSRSASRRSSPASRFGCSSDGGHSRWRQCSGWWRACCTRPASALAAVLLHADPDARARPDAAPGGGVLAAGHPADRRRRGSGAAEYGNVRWRVALLVGLGVIAGVEAGVDRRSLPEHALRRLFAVLMLGVAAQLAWRARRKPPYVPDSGTRSRVWIPSVDEPIGSIVAQIQEERPEIARLVDSPRRLLAFRTFAYIRVGLLLGRLLVEDDLEPDDTGSWVEEVARRRPRQGRARGAGRRRRGRGRPSLCGRPRAERRRAAALCGVREAPLDHRHLEKHHEPPSLLIMSGRWGCGSRFSWRWPDSSSCSPGRGAPAVPARPRRVRSRGGDSGGRPPQGGRGSGLL